MTGYGESQGASDDDPEMHERVLSDLFDRYRRMGRAAPRRKWAGGGAREKKAPRFSAEFDVHEQESDVSPSEADTNAAGWEAVDGEFGESGGRWKPSPGMHRSRTGTGVSANDPKNIGAILNAERNRRGWNRSISVGTIVGQWDLIVGKVVAQHCPVESFEEGRLVVQADSTAWAQQLRLLLPQVQKRIDEDVGRGVVEQVIVLAPKAPSWKKGPRSVPGRGPRDTYG